MIETKLRVLFLDDDELRHNVFAQNHASEEVFLHQTFTAKACIKSLQELPRFDLIFLDHDLGPNHYSGNGYNVGTGMDVVDFMCKDMEQSKRPDSVIIHSWNPERAQEMFLRLKDAKFPHVVRDEFGDKKYFKL